MAPWFAHTRRIEGWQKRFLEVIQEWQAMPFVWGQTDCFCFAGAVINALIGADPMTGVKGVYNSKKSAYKVLHGGATLADGKFYKEDGIKGFWSYWLGDEQPISFAQTGDIILCEMPDGANVTGVMAEGGKHIWAMTDDVGCQPLPLAYGVTSWRV